MNNMKRNLLRLIFSCIVSFSLIGWHILSVEASEIFGFISTDPNALPTSTSAQRDDASKEKYAPVREAAKAPSSNSGSIIAIKSRPGQDIKGEQAAQTVSAIKDEKIMGMKLYPDGTLLRGGDNRIYLITGGAKKKIANLDELSGYAGRSILKASDELLANYPDKKLSYGELVRQKGRQKVYVVSAGGKKHILNLEELRKNHFGKKIHNLDEKELAEY